MLRMAGILAPLLETFHVTVLRFRAVFVEDGIVAGGKEELCFLGPALRGGLGWTLRERCCDQWTRPAATACVEGCLRRSECAFADLFAPLPPGERMEKGPFKGVPQAPRPYSLCFDPLPGATVFAGQVFDFGITLLGDAVRHVGQVLMALVELGSSGVGRDRHRVPFRITSLTQVLPGGELLLWVVGNHEPLAYPSPVPLREWMRELPGDNVKLELTLTSPLDLVYGRKTLASMEELSTQVLIQRAFHRLWQLSVLWGNGSAPAPQDCALLDEELPVVLATSHGKLFRTRRSSHQEGTVQRMRGFMGSALYGGRLDRLHALLSLARPLGLGQSTTAGFGRFDLRILPYPI